MRKKATRQREAQANAVTPPVELPVEANTPQEIEDRKFRLDAFWRTRDELTKRDLSNTENLDRSILTLSSAALALSVTFLNSHPDLTYPLILLLGLSWIGFGGAIVLTIRGYHKSQESIAFRIEAYEQYYLHHNEAALKVPDLAYESHEKLVVWITRLFEAAIVLMLLYFGLTTWHFKKELPSEKASSHAVVRERLPPAQPSEDTKASNITRPTNTADATKQAEPKQGEVKP